MAGTKKRKTGAKRIEKCGDCPKWSPNWCPIWARHAEAKNPACPHAGTIAGMASEDAKGGGDGEEE